MTRRVVILGASSNEERYSNRAQKMLIEKGFEVIPVSPAGGTIAGVTVVPDLTTVTGEIDTITVYISPTRLTDELIETMVAKHPKRVIFNPGTERMNAMESLAQAGIVVQKACSLVLLTTGRF